MEKNKIKVLFFFASFFIPLVVYFFTLAPTVTFGDSGELITAAYFLGISHPPGSPLWTMLVKLFTYLPFNSIAWRVNFSSAFFSAFTASLFFAIQLQIVEAFGAKVNKLVIYCALLVSTFFFAFSKTVWTISVITEIWSLNNLLFCLLVLTLYQWTKTKKYIFLYISSLLFGLSLANHYVSLVLIPTLIFWILYHRKGLLKEYRSIFFLILFFFIGLSVYLYLPIRAKANPPINWGNPSNPQSFLSYIERRQFGMNLENSPEVKLGEVYVPISRFKSITDIPTRLTSGFYAFTLSVYEEFPWWFLLTSSTGVILFFINTKGKQEGKTWLYFLLICFLSTGWGFAFLTNASKPASHTYLTQYLFSFFVLCIFFGAALVLSTERLFLKFGSKSIYIPVVIGALFFFFQTYLNYKVSDWSQNRIAYFHGMHILDTAEKNAIIIADKNNWIFPLLYLTKVENKRPDVTIYDRTGNLFELVYKRKTIPIRSNSDLEKHRQIVEEDIAKKYPDRPFYYAADKNFENYEHDVNIEGILYKSKKFTAKKLDFAAQYKNILSIPSISWIEADSDYTLSYYHLRFADQLIKEGREKDALAEYQKAYQLAHRHEVALNNVATSYVRLGKLDLGMKTLIEILTINPENTVALGNLADLYKIKDQNANAIETYKKLLKLNPKNLQANIGLAGVLIRVGECEESDKIYRSLVGEGFNAQIVNNIGVCFARKGNFKEAQRYWEIAIELDSFYKPAKDNLIKLNEL